MPNREETPKMFSNTREPDYRTTGIRTTRYRMIYAMLNHSFVLRPKRIPISCGIVVIPLFR